MKETYKDVYEKIKNNIGEEGLISRVGHTVNSYKELNPREFMYLM